MNAKELLGLLEKKEFVIYGTGHVAQKFLKVIQKEHLDKNLKCFAVSFGEKEPIEGIAVKNIREIEKDSLVCIAVHNSLLNEMTGTLQDVGIDHYVWIYPYLYELLLGEPIKTDVKIKVDDIIRTCGDDYRIAIRCAAIDHYCGKNTNGFDWYMKSQALHCSMKTAEERLRRFCKLISDWQRLGYDESKRILINDNYEIIDGNHRVALAWYYGQEEIKCEIFGGNISACEVHGENAMLTKRILLQNGFSLQEIQELDKINQMIKGGIRNESISR